MSRPSAPTHNSSPASQAHQAVSVSAFDRSGAVSPVGQGPLPAWVADYLEAIAKGYNLSDSPFWRAKKIGAYSFGSDEPRCGYWSMVGQCSNGHQFAKSLGCGREWCEDCREEFEGRRFARWLPKAQQIGTMGYLVITTPPGNRPRSKDEWRRIRRSIVRSLKRMGFARGLSRWHWFGDKSHKWYPHLNILLDCGYLPKAKLDQVKEMAARALGVGHLVVNYQYSDDVNMKVHWLKYVLRATFLDRSWDDAMAEELHDFNNQHSWGVWKDEPVWELEEGQEEATAVGHLEAGTCPHCGAPIKWIGGRDGLIQTELLPGYGFKELGAGYWELPIGSPAIAWETGA